MYQINALGFLLKLNYVLLNTCLNVPESLENVAKCVFGIVHVECYENWNALLCFLEVIALSI